jgi:organic radical activating enzyme
MLQTFKNEILIESNTYDTLIYIDISGECNWGCNYCNATNKYSSGDISKALPISKIINLRKINYKHDDVKFIITGGEPSIYGIKYNQSLINILRKIHKTKIFIEYFSNLSASTDFYIKLDVDKYSFSYHDSQITFNNFINSFEEVLKYKNSFMRINNLSKKEFTEKLKNYNDKLFDRVIWYEIHDINSNNLFSEEYKSNNIYELTSEKIWNYSEKFINHS